MQDDFFNLQKNGLRKGIRKMKKIKILFVLFLIFFILSCGSESGSEGGGGENNSSPSTEVVYIGWSGNWWAEDDFRTYSLALTTLDSKNYIGHIQITNKQYGNILTADLTGQYNWGLHPSLCGDSYNWMLITLNNIQGQLDIGENISSGIMIFKDYCLQSPACPDSDLIRIESYCFQTPGGLSIIGNHLYKRV